MNMLNLTIRLVLSVILTKEGVVSFKELLGYKLSREIELLYAMGLFGKVVYETFCITFCTRPSRSDANAILLKWLRISFR